MRADDPSRWDAKVKGNVGHMRRTSKLQPVNVNGGLVCNMGQRKPRSRCSASTKFYGNIRFVRPNGKPCIPCSSYRATSKRCPQCFQSPKYPLWNLGNPDNEFGARWRFFNRDVSLQPFTPFRMLDATTHAVRLFKSTSAATAPTASAPTSRACALA